MHNHSRVSRIYLKDRPPWSKRIPQKDMIPPSAGNTLSRTAFQASSAVSPMDFRKGTLQMAGALLPSKQHQHTKAKIAKPHTVPSLFTFGRPLAWCLSLSSVSRAPGSKWQPELLAHKNATKFAAKVGVPGVVQRANLAKREE